MGIPDDIEASEDQHIDLFESACSYQEASAYAGLGDCHVYGWRVPIDYAEACKQYQKGATLEDPLCLARLGMFYWNGWGGLKQDPLAAVMSYERAIKNGSGDAAVELGKLKQSGCSVYDLLARAVDSSACCVCECGRMCLCESVCTHSRKIVACCGWDCPSILFRFKADIVKAAQLFTYAADMWNPEVRVSVTLFCWSTTCCDIVVCALVSLQRRQWQARVI